MEIRLEQYNKHLVFEATNDSGYSLLVGKSEEKTTKAIRPMELLLVSLASCSSIDIINILNKQKQVDFDYSVKVESTRKDEVPAIFEEITINFIFTGDVSSKKIERAVKLSLEKYCSVSKIIQETATINHIITLNGKTI